MLNQICKFLNAHMSKFDVYKVLKCSERLVQSSRGKKYLNFIIRTSKRSIRKLSSAVLANRQRKIFKKIHYLLTVKKRVSCCHIKRNKNF